jgi:sugar O-acyltransferase (sialic acid O-acetyltransferase NeuD family)
MKKAVIFGLGDFAQVAYVYLRDDSEYRIEAFTANRHYIEQEQLLGLPVTAFEDVDRTYPAREFAIFVAIGFSRVNAVRREIFEQCRERGYTVPAYVNSTVRRWNETRIGEGCFIFENNVVQPFVRIGDDCVLWSGGFIGHHTTIGDHVFIASTVAISGRCTVGERAFIGANATVRDGVTIAPAGVIGAGAIVLKNTVESGVYKTAHTEPQERLSHELRNL